MKLGRERVVTKTPEQLARMQQAGAIVAQALEAMRQAVAPGVTTGELDQIADTVIRGMDARPSFLGYHGYPATVCASVNDEVVHGIPGPRVLEEGDIVSVDVGAIWEGYQGDAAITVAVGAIDPEVQRLLQTTQVALQAGIQAARAGQRMGQISHAIEQVARAEGFCVIREYGGHGIGSEMHEPPNIPNWGPADRGVHLRPGMTFALEPMIAIGTSETRVLDDGWTVVTADGSLSAHFEHTIAVTENGAEILTRQGD